MGEGKGVDDWLFAMPKIGRSTFRVHDLGHTCASLWLAEGADPKVVQRILWHASAAMTMDLYGQLIDNNLWEAARRFADTTGASAGDEGRAEGSDKGHGADDEDGAETDGQAG